MIKKPVTIKELCEFIWYLEEKYGLLDFEVDGVKVWQSMRMSIYYELAQLLGIFSHPHSKVRKIDKIKHLIKYIKNSIFDNYFTLYNVDSIVFSHTRTVNVDGELMDIYTKYFTDELIQKSIGLIEFEKSDAGEHKRERKEHVHYLDWIELMQSFLGIFVSVRILSEQQAVLKQIEEEIASVCGVKLSLIQRVCKHIKRFNTIYFLYDKVFKKVMPQSIYLVVSYGKAAMIKAAKDNEIEVRELQHGIFSKFHLGYSFPNYSGTLAYFPDKFYVWNNFWKEMIRFPIEEENIVIDHFRYLDEQKSKFSHLKRDDNQVVVLSQGALGNSIAEKVLKYYSRFESCIVKYKLHPGEFDRWQEYPALVQLSHLDNVEIIKDEIPLYELFATSGLQVGVFSTALYEGIEFGCRTLLFQLPGIEYMNKFIDSYENVEVL